MNYLPNHNHIKRKSIVKFLAVILIIQSFFHCSCVEDRPYSKNVLSTLDMAGANKKELISVLEYYSKKKEDSLKLKAACYLIANMKNHYSKNSIRSIPDIVKSAFNYVDSLTKATFYSDKCLTSFEFVDTLHKVLYSLEYIPSYRFIDSIINVEKAKVCDNLVVGYDRTADFENHISKVAKRLIDDIKPQKSFSVYLGDPLNVKGVWLIKHIDNAFKVWEESPYARDMGYEEFTQTILPYRYRNEALGVSSEFICDRFYNIVHSPDSFNIEVPVRRFNFYTYCADCFENDGKLLGDFGIYNIIQFYQFECSKQSEWTARVLNACGIPTYFDYTPIWLNRARNHFWVAVRDTSGVYNPFTPKWQLLYKKEYFDMTSKVYRRVFNKMSNSPLFLKHKSEDIPNIFKSPFIKDVSEQYHKVANISVAMDTVIENVNLAYLGIFSSNGWKPVAWGRIDKDKKVLEFEKVPVDVVYISGFYIGKSFVATGSPFLLSKNGKIEKIIPDNRVRQDMHLSRKYPVKAKMRWMMEETVGTKIQGANVKDFSDAINLYVITYADLCQMGIKAVNILVKSKFRYIRCVAKKGSILNVSIMEVFSKPLKDKHIIEGSQPSVLSLCDINNTRMYGKLTRVGVSPLDTTDFDAENLQDSNMETFITDKEISMKLNYPCKIEQIRFAPRNANNGIIVGDKYELMYYDQKWVSGGVKKAEYNFLEYEGIPANTIYWLRNLDRGKEEHSFVYRDGKQVFINSQ